MSKYTHDYRPRFDDITNVKIERLSLAYGVPKNVLLRQLTEAATKMIEFVQRHPECLGDFDYNDISPETLLWKASESRQLMKDKAKNSPNQVA